MNEILRYLCSFLSVILRHRAAVSKLTVRPKTRGAQTEQPVKTHASLQFSNTDSVRSYLMNIFPITNCI